MEQQCLSHVDKEVDMLMARDRHLSCEGCRKMALHDEYRDWVTCKVTKSIRHIAGYTVCAHGIVFGYQMCKMGTCPHYKRNRHA